MKCNYLFKLALSLLLFLNATNLTWGQSTKEVDEKEKVYHWGLNDHKELLIGSAALWGGSLLLLNGSAKIKEEDLSFRNRENIWGIDRGATFNFSTSAADWSDRVALFASVLPFTHFLSSKGRGEAKAITGMLLEGFLINDGLTNVLKATTNRFRPFTYNEAVPLENKLDNGARYSFISGHTSNTAFVGFFTAKIFSDLYPDSKWKPYIWTTAATLPAVVGYFRYEAGKHFPTDILAGYLVGSAIGYLVPRIHKQRNDHFSLRATSLYDGFSIAYCRTL